MPGPASRPTPVNQENKPLIPSRLNKWARGWLLGQQGLSGAAKQAVQSFDPRTKAGLLNAAGMFLGPKEIGPLYHGTPAYYPKFNIAKTKPDSLFGRGQYLTDNPEIANTYAEQIQRMYNNSLGTTSHFFESPEEALRFIAEKPTHRRPAGTDPYAHSGSFNYANQHDSPPYQNHPGGYYPVIEHKTPMQKVAPNIGIHALRPSKMLRMDEEIPKGMVDAGVKYMKDRFYGKLNNTYAKGIPYSGYGENLGKSDPYWNERFKSMVEYLTQGGPYSNKGPIQTPADLYSRLSAEMGYKANINKFLAKMGYDALHYEGGKRLGGGEHNAYVALKENIVRPYYSKTVRNLPKRK